MKINKKLNTIYIISKGRPNCRTAQTLTEMNYPGEWFIVCGTNDETLPQYQEKWGKNRVLVFDWQEEVKRSNLLDNFGVQTMGSGAVPVRNATRRIAEQRGELRHWQFDDDYMYFRHINTELKKNETIKNGAFFEYELNRIATFAHEAKLNNAGFCLGMESFPEMVKTFSKRVFNAHNMPTDENLFMTWRGRMNDDLINALDVYHSGGKEMAFKFMTLMLAPTQSEKGGNSDIYESEGTVRKTAYAVLVDPRNTKLVIRYGRYHHKEIGEAYLQKSLGRVMKKYDFLIVGAGLFGSVFAHQAKKKGYKVLVIDQRNHIGGNCYTERISGIDVHKYGAHIFHTSNEEVWEFITKFGKFKAFTNQPIAVIGDTTYNLPFNMNMFSKLFGVVRPDDVLRIIEKETALYRNVEPTNLEEQALKQVGKTIYETFIKEYTEKQWDKPCTELPAETIKRLPIRLTYDNNYFNDKYQGIPYDGYTALFEKMLKGIKVKLNYSYIDAMKSSDQFDKVIYTGMIDEFFDYELGELEYRSLQFIEIEKDTENYQGNAVFNYPSKQIGYIRSIEHKHFVGVKSPTTIISYEFSVQYRRGMIPFYPIQTPRNIRLYNKYSKLTEKYPRVYFKGRLGSFKYFDMDDTIEHSLNLAKEVL